MISPTVRRKRSWKLCKVCNELLVGQTLDFFSTLPVLLRPTHNPTFSEGWPDEAQFGMLWLRILLKYVVNTRRSVLCCKVGVRLNEEQAYYNLGVGA